MKIIRAIKDWRHRKDAEEIRRLRQALEVQTEMAQKAEQLALTAIKGYEEVVDDLNALRSIFNLDDNIKN